MRVDKEAYLIQQLHSAYIGDDAAVVGEMLYSMDAFFEDTHFKREWMTMAQIGRKAMLVNLSDAIAMNALPLYALVTVSLPHAITKREIDILMQSLEQTAGAYGCEVIGGDTVAGEKLHLSIALISHSKAPLLRKGLKKGDLLAYTGVLGESKRDLERLMNGESIPETSRFYEPVLQEDFVKRARPLLHAGMDISDGLYCDTNKLLDQNGYGFDILKNITEEEGFSGEEYEMLVGFDPSASERVREIAEQCGTTLTVFAQVAENHRRFPCKSHHFS
jgi:thiamine-monophosphate kinase